MKLQREAKEEYGLQVHKFSITLMLYIKLEMEMLGRQIPASPPGAGEWLIWCNLLRPSQMGIDFGPRMVFQGDWKDRGLAVHWIPSGFCFQFMLHPLTGVRSGELSNIPHSHSSAAHEFTSSSGIHKPVFPMLPWILVLQNLREILSWTFVAVFHCFLIFLCIWIWLFELRGLGEGRRLCAGGETSGCKCQTEVFWYQNGLI